MHRVYVLNNSFECVSTTTTRRALFLVEEGRADVVKWSDRAIHHLKKVIRIPLIIRIFKYVKAFGRSLPFSKLSVWERDDYICQYCGVKTTKGTVTTDHVYPDSKGGKATYENMVTCCKKCNSKKEDKTCEDAHMFPLRRPFKPQMSKNMQQISDEARRLLAIQNKG